ncbi:hypothetical protein GO613_22915, partial [Azoarcus communis]|uniref:hypothetical protein n=1 Tax=Parazoarcus communis TaxID=41977 RepID=UPI001459BFB0
MQITGSTVSASQALTLTAGNHLLLDAAESSDQRHFRKTTTQTQGLGRKAVANTLDTFSVRQTG